jgi:hypothetical protein
MFPEYWKIFTEAHGLIDVSACLSESDDLSGLGADLRFLSEAQSREELTEFWPGIGIGPHGYVPVASCSGGSGDYYYINRNNGQNGPLYRVYHDAVGPHGHDPGTAVVRVLDDYAAILGHLER